MLATFCPNFPSQRVPSQAFFQGKLKISGNMGMAMKLQNLQVTAGKAKLWDLEASFGPLSLISLINTFTEHIDVFDLEI